mmetsp:Transcript_15058/g.57153  ORF Transcript_15058/g.57153 Transcript_15058/m.57153 type:complete len:130 (+) Transcript_15058:2810-3199(+)
MQGSAHAGRRRLRGDAARSVASSLSASGRRRGSSAASRTATYVSVGFCALALVVLCLEAIDSWESAAGGPAPALSEASYRGTYSTAPAVVNTRIPPPLYKGLAICTGRGALEVVGLPFLDAEQSVIHMH